MTTVSTGLPKGEAGPTKLPDARQPREGLAFVSTEEQPALPVRTRISEVIQAAEAQNPRYSADPLTAKREWEQRFAVLKTRAEGGDVLAMAALHYCYAKGLGVDADAKEAFKWAEKAAKTGDANGKHVLARCYLDGIGCDVNTIAGEKMLREAAEAKDPSPLARLAFALRTLRKPSSELTEKEAAKALDHLKAAAKSGVNMANDILGDVYTQGVPGVRPDPAKALEYFKKGAEGGSAFSQLYLGLMYSSGEKGHPKIDLPKAREYLEKAAASGYPQAQWMLGRELLQVSGTKGRLAATGLDGFTGRFGFAKDTTKAIAWLELAAKQQHADAMVVLSALYADGTGVKADLNRSRELLEAAVKLGSPNAYLERGRRQFAGTAGYKKDTDAAIADWTVAAKGGNVDAMTELGKAYERGYGGAERDVNKPYLLHRALGWYAQAAAQGDPFAKKRIALFVSTYLPKDSFANDSFITYPRGHGWSPKDVMEKWYKEDKAGAIAFAKTYNVLKYLPSDDKKK